ncbi:MAG: DNA topoisomerase IB, partial [Thermomicrobiales bacterium]
FELADPQMARIVRRLRDLPGQALFQYVDDEDQLVGVDSEDVNDYLRGLACDNFTAKDFRTWAGTVLAASELCSIEVPASAAEANRAIVKAVDETAKCLGNTRAVCRSSYIHPRVLESFVSGELSQLAERSGRWKAESGLSREELLVKRLLEQA